MQGSLIYGFDSKRVVVDGWVELEEKPNRAHRLETLIISERIANALSSIEVYVDGKHVQTFSRSMPYACSPLATIRFEFKRVQVKRNAPVRLHFKLLHPMRVLATATGRCRLPRKVAAALKSGAC